MNRVLNRESCFKLLFLTDFYDLDREEQINLYFELEEFLEFDSDDINKKISEHAREEIKANVVKCLELLPAIDEKLSSNISGWSLNRIGKIEKAILRFALYEIDYVEKVPNSVAINEAVNLAKKFGTDESPKFINGVLAKLV